MLKEPAQAPALVFYRLLVTAMSSPVTTLRSVLVIPTTMPVASATKVIAKATLTSAGKPKPMWRLGSRCIVVPGRWRTVVPRWRRINTPQRRLSDVYSIRYINGLCSGRRSNLLMRLCLDLCRYRDLNGTRPKQCQSYNCEEQLHGSFLSLFAS